MGGDVERLAFPREYEGLSRSGGDQPGTQGQGYRKTRPIVFWTGLNAMSVTDEKIIRIGGVC